MSDICFTVGELIAELKCFPEDMEVRIEQPTGNYWNQIAGTPLSNLEEGRVRVGDKNTTCPNKVVDEDDEDDSFETKEVVLLS